MEGWKSLFVGTGFPCPIGRAPHTDGETPSLRTKYPFRVLRVLRAFRDSDTRSEDRNLTECGTKRGLPLILSFLIILVQTIPLPSFHPSTLPFFPSYPVFPVPPDNPGSDNMCAGKNFPNYIRYK